MYKRWKIALWFPNLAGLNAQTCLICSVKVDTGTWCPAFLRWQDIEVKITICWGRTNLFHTLHLNFLHQSVVEDIYRIEMIHLVVNIALRFLVLYNKVIIGLNSVRPALFYSFCRYPVYSAVLLYNKVIIGLNSVNPALSYSFCRHPAYSAVRDTI